MLGRETKERHTDRENRMLVREIKEHHTDREREREKRNRDVKEL